MAKLYYKEESYIIQGVAFDIYKKFRNHHKEKAYQRAFYNRLKDKGLDVDKEKRIPIYDQGEKIATYIPDLVVENKIFIELKAKPFLTKSDKNQFWYYLKISDYKLGYLINFGKSDGVQIIRRVI